jgi:hypothetical protein
MRKRKYNQGINKVTEVIEPTVESTIPVIEPITPETVVTTEPEVKFPVKIHLFQNDKLVISYPVQDNAGLTEAKSHAERRGLTIVIR